MAVCRRCRVIAELIAAVRRSGPRGAGDTHKSFSRMLTLAALTVLIRLPFLTDLLSHRDEVQYALGLHHFDVLAHEPHPPGSPFYIVLGRLALLFTSDEHHAFVALSVIASAAATSGEYVLTRLAFGRRAALLASV